jgi:hypothetical protein
MRRVILCLFVSTPLIGGCAMLIAESGQNLGQIASREEMQASSWYAGRQRRRG